MAEKKTLYKDTYIELLSLSLDWEFEKAIFTYDR